VLNYVITKKMEKEELFHSFLLFGSAFL